MKNKYRVILECEIEQFIHYKTQSENVLDSAWNRYGQYFLERNWNVVSAKKIDTLDEASYFS